MTPGLTARKRTEYIAVHCSASKPSPDTDAKAIDRWHRQRGFVMIGYHYVIKTDGTVETGRDEDAVGAHVVGFNSVSIGVCMVGGVTENGPTGKAVNNFTDAQFAALTHLLGDLKEKYPLAIIQGHRDFPNVAKECPCFDVKPWVAKTFNTEKKP